MKQLRKFAEVLQTAPRWGEAESVPPAVSINGLPHSWIIHWMVFVMENPWKSHLEVDEHWGVPLFQDTYQEKIRVNGQIQISPGTGLEALTCGR